MEHVFQENKMRRNGTQLDDYRSKKTAKIGNRVNEL